ncbi:HNH endonuclease family protein [Streptomyces aureoverticillatus]|uniref:HNH endonuclease family protein n=1 Tax=Streptomyces aureoverticillatus TaxID=66871 RepID=UPI0013DC3C71|nr:HNH endonuclease family protein [Streptomyces aureoverticillatus]QIB49561.1 HNH endonuclease [Streptomyces aureoverticillatus]
MRIRAAATLAALAALLIPTPAAHAAPGDEITVPVRDALATLTVADESRTGYDRDLFRHWIDADRDGCSTRNEVLLDEAVTAPDRTGRCTLTGGRWYSPYDDTYVDGPRALDIDHYVPLAETWRSGASGWTAKEREAYANDLDDSRALIAVTAASNRSKSDQDPSTWMPPAAGYHCEYATTWVTIKTRWGLTVDRAEAAALTSTLNECPNTPVTVELAR